MHDEHPQPHGGPADSAGQPFSGRHFEASTSAFEGDDGSASPHVLETMRRFVAGQASQADVVDALRDARLLVPLVAHAGETGIDDHGHLVDKTQELSIVTVTTPDGRSALPAFTSTAAMAAWNPKARPIPTEARRVALAAASENTDIVIVDATSPTEFVVRRPAVWAMAQGMPWRSPADDPEVLAVFSESVVAESAVSAVSLQNGDPTSRMLGAELVARLELLPGLDQGALTTLLARLHERWSQSPIVAQRVDSLAVTLVTAPRWV
ncbi:MAG: hypothetical protein JWQ19_2774 [Subtercola sp.]|nr:hypothetical protein [Subtercola sp.]